jgi:hypothetical protein
MEDAFMDLASKRLARKAVDFRRNHEDGEDAEVADTDVTEHPHSLSYPNSQYVLRWPR